MDIPQLAVIFGMSIHKNVCIDYTHILWNFCEYKYYQTLLPFMLLYYFQTYRAVSRINIWCSRASLYVSIKLGRLGCPRASLCASMKTSLCISMKTWGIFGMFLGCLWDVLECLGASLWKLGHFRASWESLGCEIKCEIV